MGAEGGSPGSAERKEGRIFSDRFLSAGLAFTFRDFILVPGATEVDPARVNLETRATVNHRIKIPFISSPMDTVTEHELAITLARLGGLGVLHRNCSVEDEVEMARKVKRAESTVIRDVITTSPGNTVAEAVAIMKKYSISGLPVTEGERLVGIVTGRDVRFAQPERRVSDVMTKSVITADENVTLEEAREMLHKHRIEKLPLVDAEGRLRGLITFRDIELRGRYPNASRDEGGRLLCAAAASPFDIERCRSLDKVVDIIVFDIAHHHNRHAIQAAKRVAQETSADIVVGNIGTYQATVDVAEALDGRLCGLRVGVGSGSICVTSEVTKVSAPTLFAVAQVADALRELGLEIPVWADGGVVSAGDAVLALAAGASAVMCGNLFARTREAPGALIAIGGQYFKTYRGMGSPSARARRFAVDRYLAPAKGIAEGVEGYVPYKGDAEIVAGELSEGLRAAMGYIGAASIGEIWEKAVAAQISPLGAAETRAHDIMLPGEARRAT